MSKAKTNRAKTTSPLVAKALSVKLKYRKSWLDLMTAGHQAEIIEAAQQWPQTGRPWTALAQVIKDQFGLEVTVRVITDALKKAAS